MSLTLLIDSQCHPYLRQSPQSQRGTDLETALLRLPCKQDSAQMVPRGLPGTHAWKTEGNEKPLCSRGSSRQ